MKYKSLVAASLALSMASTPVIAAAPAAAPAPAAKALSLPQPAAETVEGSALYRTGILLPLAAIAVVALAVYLIFGSGNNDDKPASP